MNKEERFQLLTKKQEYFQQKQSVLSNILPEVFVVLALLLVLTMSSIFFSTFKYYQIRQESMRPLFNNYQNEDVNDGVFVRVGSGFEVGDIIVLKHEKTTLIKRVIATGGDKISIVKKDFASRTEYLVQRIAKGTTVSYTLVENYINKEDPQGMKKVYEAFEKYMLSTTKQKETVLEDGNFITYLVLEENEVFYLGDNRGNSLDSSTLGPTTKDVVVGKVEIVIWKEQNFLFYILSYILGFKNI